MDRPLPLKIKPLKLVSQEESLSGFVLLSDCPRLKPLLAAQEGQIEAELHFGQGSDGRRCVMGEVTASVELTCERCGHPVSYDIKAGLKLGLVMNDEQAARLPKDYEPLLLETEDPISMVELLEEEILLGLPMFAKHEPGQCPATTSNEG